MTDAFEGQDNPVFGELIPNCARCNNQREVTDLAFDDDVPLCHGAFDASPTCYERTVQEGDDHPEHVARALAAGRQRMGIVGSATIDRPPSVSPRIVDLFAGPGGWSEGLRSLGLSDIGIEWDEAACATRRAAGHPTIRADVENYPPDQFLGFDGLIASPPCPDFSVAGKMAGRAGESGRLVDMVPRWVDVVRPEWVVCEQVPLVLPIWQEHAHTYRSWGYSVWTGILNAANYGVPQTRQRAILIASQSIPARPPDQTHAREAGATLFGDLLPWVTMADALGWGSPDRPYFTLAPGTKGGGADVAMLGGSGARREMRALQASETWVVDRRTNSKDGRGGMVPTVPVPMDRPAPTLTGKAGGQWCFTTPATTIAGDPRITARCHHDEGSQGANAKTTEQVREGDYDGTEPVKLTVPEALILQSFRPDYPVQGNKTKQFEQIGNAVPPMLASAVLAEVIREPMTLQPIGHPTSIGREAE